MRHCIVFLSLFLSLIVHGQEKDNKTPIPSPYWKARWIVHPTASGNQFGVFHFRKTIELANPPSSFIIHVSADNRYRLFVNGISVAAGPAISDLTNWHYETIDIGPYLQKGKNCIAATVWNFAEYRAFAQISYQTAFIMQGGGSSEEMINTNESWKVIQDTGYTPLPINMAALESYIVVPQGEKLDGQKHTWGFEQISYSDAAWLPANPLWFTAKMRGYGTDGNWMLTPRTIPLLEEKQQRFSSIRRVEGMAEINTNFLSGTKAIEIPANKTVTVLLDQSMLTNAYPTLLVSKGKGASIGLTYAEALFDSDKKKGNRNSIENKKIKGFSDVYNCDGGSNRLYAPLHFRTFRYLQLDITTKEEPLVMQDFYSIFTGYPFKENAAFGSNNPSLQKIWETGWRTARLCALDSYVDCPYYEQMQYVGDTRIQALISLYVSGDARLMKKAIDDIAHSAFQDGLTESRYPSRDMQVIPTFSLWWVCMLHDYWMHRKDDVFVESHLKLAASILNWYQDRLGNNGLLGKLEWWQFVDWSWGWSEAERSGGVPPGGTSGGSSIISLQYAYTLQKAADLMNAYGKKSLAVTYTTLAKKITDGVYQQCWDANKIMMADTKEKKQFSQHANILAVLSNAVPITEQKKLIDRIIADTSITQCTYYFKFYLFEALKKVKTGDKFIELLAPWQQMIDLGLSTFAESPEPVRSDCHAWSASPNYEFLSLVCGVKPAAPAFEKVLIEPFMGSLTSVEGKLPHPAGTIEILLQKTSSGIRARIILPKTVSGSFLWKGKTKELQPGNQIFEL
jgi:alpha-L-rhamnosidase